MTQEILSKTSEMKQKTEDSDSISRKPEHFLHGLTGCDAASASATALLSDFNSCQAKTVFILPIFGRLRCDIGASCISVTGKLRPASLWQVSGAVLSPRCVGSKVEPELLELHFCPSAFRLPKGLMLCFFHFFSFLAK